MIGASSRHPFSEAFPPALLALQQALPVFVGCSLAMVAHRATGASYSIPGLTVLLCGIAAAYSFDRLIDAGRNLPPRWLRRALAVVFVLASLGMLLMAAFIPAHCAILTFLFSVVGLTYSRLKRLPLAKTFLITVLWTIACIALPLQSPAVQSSLLTMAASLALAVSAACILCDLKDVEEDRARAVITLPVLLGARTTCLVTAALAAVAAVIAAWESRIGLALGASLLVAASCFPRLLQRNALGTIVVDAALVLPGLLILFHLV